VSSPRLSVVVAASHSTRAVAECLDALGRRVDVEIVVVAPPQIERPVDLHAAIVWISAEPNDDVHRLRGLGLSHTRADVVALTEDSCVASPGWVQAWISAFSDPGDHSSSADPSQSAAVRPFLTATGSVNPSHCGSALDAAVFLCEYVPFLPPLDRGLGGRLAGNNFAARRDALTAALDSHEVHEWTLYGDDVVHIVPDAVCTHVRRYSAAEAFRDRLLRGYEFGRFQAVRASPGRRCVMACLGPAIFLSQSHRLFVTLWAKSAFRRIGFRPLPWALALLAAWSLAEWVGWMSASTRPLGRRRRETVDRSEVRSPGRTGSTQRGYTRRRTSA
jgi:hypothetical protein